MSADAYRWIFRLAAFFNVVVAIGLFVAGDGIWPSLGMDVPRDRLLLHLFLVFVLLFGAAYFWVSRDLTRNHGLVALGAAGKALAFFTVLLHFFQGTASAQLLALIAPDLAFAAVFVAFLMRPPEAA